jgi:hypothetical protein
VQEDGQIQRLDEAEAGFRLASISRAVPLRHRGMPEAAASGTPAAAPPATTAKLARFWLRKRGTASSHKHVGRPQPGRPAAPQAAQSPGRAFIGMRRWMWAIATIVLLIVAMVLLGHSGLVFPP